MAYLTPFILSLPWFVASLCMWIRERRKWMEEEYRGCDNCYYENFDPVAYPCSMCIRGYEREDKWFPRKTEYIEQNVRDAFNAGYECGMEQTEPQSDDIVVRSNLEPFRVTESEGE